MATLSWDHRWEEPGRVTPARIAAIASVIIIHVVAVLALLVPARWEPPVLSDSPIRIIFLEPLVIPPPTPPPPVVKPVVLPPKATPVLTKPATPKPVAESPVVLDTARPLDLPADPPSSQTSTPPTGTAGPAAQSAKEGVVVLVSPKPPYPREALLGHIQGTVILRIVVDAQGNPTSVTVEKSSGHRDLDKAARETVARRWKFQGTGVEQTARLPIGFTID